MTVYDFCGMCVDGSMEVTIWDIDAEKEVFKGSADHAMYSDFADREVESFDPPYDIGFCLNVSGV